MVLGTSYFLHWISSRNNGGETMTNKHVLLFSGGLDSFIAYHRIKQFFKEEPQLVYVALGHRYENQELASIMDLQRRGVIPTVQIDYSLNLKTWEESDANIPMRNSLLAHVAARYGDWIWMIVQKGETNIPDRSKTFFRDLSMLLTHLNDGSVYKRVDSPFWDMTKVDMVKWYKDIAKLPIDDLLDTTSCYTHRDPLSVPCGHCSACFRRWVSFELNDIEEHYSVNPWESQLAQEYLKKGQVGFYGAGRDEEILMALEKRGVKVNG